jgi:8-oxo-dGTP pyrophosphatase MutT (NUDIX family)
VLLVNGDDRVLLFHGRDPARPHHRYWVTPGGGLDDEESSAAGAARELAEETGLRLAPEELGEPVWDEVTEYPFDGRWYRQRQEFFLVRVPSWEVDTRGFDELERDSIDDHRWWEVAELESTDERVYPRDLAPLLRRLLAGGLASGGGRASGGGPASDGGFASGGGRASGGGPASDGGLGSGGGAVAGGAWGASC